MTQLTEQQMQEVTASILDFIKKGGTFQEVKGLDEATMETTYAVAYNLYNSKKYEDAEKVFMFLSLMNHYEKKYFLGLGACRQVLKKNKEAIEAYIYASLLDLEDPMPPFYAASCHMAMGDKEAAIKAYDAAADLAGGKEQFRDIEQQSRNMMELLEKRDHSAT